MQLIQWTQELSVSIEEFDRQHKKLVNLMNLLHNSMNKGENRDVLKNFLNELADYTVYHFKSEEKLLQEHMFPLYAIHKKEHDELTKQIFAIKTSFEQGNTSLTVEFMDFLKNWLNKHILQVDKKYCDFLNSKGVH
ncbi:MAG TPA: bacteriohemerythrin [Candidatus Acidoferrales bacterium]|nr:bacteriohemerythrin [Candidatus Acidoferrales bacterium]